MIRRLVATSLGPPADVPRVVSLRDDPRRLVGIALPVGPSGSGAARLRRAVPHVASGAVRPPVSRVVSLAEAPAALADLAARRTTGKIIVRREDAA